MNAKDVWKNRNVWLTADNGFCIKIFFFFAILSIAMDPSVIGFPRGLVWNQNMNTAWNSWQFKHKKRIRSCMHTAGSRVSSATSLDYAKVSSRFVCNCSRVSANERKRNVWQTTTHQSWHTWLLTGIQSISSHSVFVLNVIRRQGKLWVPENG